MLAMESLPAMARLSLHECASTGVRDDGHKWHTCQDCKKFAKIVSVPGKYCQPCTDKRNTAREAERRNAKKAAEAAAKQAEKAREEENRQQRLKDEKAAREKRTQDDADARRRNKQLEDEAKEKRRKERQAEKQIAEQMGDLAKKTDLEPDEWASFFGAGPAQQQAKNDAENPPILDEEVQSGDMTERARDTIKRFTGGRNEDGMQVDSEGCCAQQGKR